MNTVKLFLQRLLHKSNSFLYEMFRTRTRFENGCILVKLFMVSSCDEPGSPVVLRKHFKKSPGGYS